MFSIASHIEYLLLSHQCVVAPGLGAFLVHESPAFYDEATGCLMPPSRTIGFNPEVTINDGLLAQSVARKERISIESARQKVESTIEAFRSQLRDSSPLPFGNLGDMSLSGTTIIFEPSPSSAVCYRYMGLLPLPIVSQEVKSQKVHDTTPEVSRESSSVVTLGLRIAASLILVLLGCGIFLTTDNLLGQRDSQRASLDSGLRASLPSVTPASIVSLPISREIVLNIARPSETRPITPAETSIGETPGRYLLVVGSFPTLEAAQRYTGEDSTLRILEMDGRYRIYAASASTYTEAARLAEDVRDTHPSVWICRR